MHDYKDDLVGKTLLTTLPRERCTFEMRHRKQHASLTIEEATNNIPPRRKEVLSQDYAVLLNLKNKVLGGARKVEGGHGRGIQASKQLRWLLQSEYQRMFKRTSEGQKGLKNTAQGEPHSFLVQACTAKTNTVLHATDGEKPTINNSLCSAWFNCSDGGTISVYLMYRHF